MGRQLVVEQSWFQSKVRMACLHWHQCLMMVFVHQWWRQKAMFAKNIRWYGCINYCLLFQVLKFIAAIYWHCNLNFKLFQVTTQDGYILSMQRIPAGRSGKTVGKRLPVLLQHGLLMVGYCSMNDWFSHDSWNIFLPIITSCVMVAGWDNMAAITSRPIFGFPLGW